MTSVDLRRLVGVLSVATVIPKTVAACTGILLVVVTLRRFLKGSGRISSSSRFSSCLWPTPKACPGQSLLLDWSLEFAGFLILLYAVTRLVGWNPVAYLIWMWTDFNAGAVEDLFRFCRDAEPRLFWPSIERLVVMLLAPGCCRALGPLDRGRNSRVVQGLF